MHLLAEQTIDIGCSAEKAYNFACNLEHFGAWFPGVIAMESANDLAHATVGKQYRETVTIPLRGERKVGITVKAAEPHRRLVTEGTLKPLLPRMEMQFDALGPDACRLTWRMSSRNSGFLAKALMVPLARATLQKRASIGVARLKQVLERA